MKHAGGRAIKGNSSFSFLFLPPLQALADGIALTPDLHLRAYYYVPGMGQNARYHYDDVRPAVPMYAAHRIRMNPPSVFGSGPH